MVITLRLYCHLKEQAHRQTIDQANRPYWQGTGTLGAVGAIERERQEYLPFPLPLPYTQPASLEFYGKLLSAILIFFRFVIFKNYLHGESKTNPILASEQLKSK